MDFELTPEQRDLRDLVRDVLVKRPTRSREVGCHDTALWARLATELGLTGLAVEPGYAVELAVVLEETGRALLALPYLSTVVAAQVLPQEYAAGIAAGETIAALSFGPGLSAGDGEVDGTVEAVMDADVATLAVVVADGTDGPGLYAVAMEDARRVPTPTLDPSRPAATLTFAAASATRLPATPEQALDALHLALAVESLGVAAASLESTVEHLKTRRQFGAPLASFQALRHRVADLLVQLDAATSTTWYAVRAGAGERPVLAPMAKLVAADAAYTMTAQNIQLHGGIGFTWEHDAHRYFKRATVTRLTHGDPVTLRRTLAARAGLFA